MPQLRFSAPKLTKSQDVVTCFDLYGLQLIDTQMLTTMCVTGVLYVLFVKNDPFLTPQLRPYNRKFNWL